MAESLTPSPPAARAGPVVALGELLIDMVAVYPAPTDLAGAVRFERAAGGAPANVAVGVARLGAPAGFIGKVGADPFGEYLASTLLAEGVDVTLLPRSASAKTAVAFVALGPGGERDFVFYPETPAHTALEPADIEEEYVSRASVLHVGSLTLVAEPARSATYRAVELAAARGVPVSVDVNLRLGLWPSARRARAELLELASHANVLKLSDDELDFLTGSRELGAAEQLLTDGTALVALTRGTAGSSYLAPRVAGGGTGDVAGFEVEAVDTTGAGDAFMAALLVAHREDPGVSSDEGKLRSAFRRANAFAALTVTRHGAIPALPSRAELDAFLEPA